MSFVHSKRETQRAKRRMINDACMHCFIDGICFDHHE